jgi:hypothetical protein
MQPHILFPILIFAFGMGAFLTTFVGDISSEDSFNPSEIVGGSQNIGEPIFSKESILNVKNSQSVEKDESEDWLNSFQKDLSTDFHYPVTEVSIKLPLNNKVEKNTFTLSTEYLEPYQNFCVNQILNKEKNIRYKLIESGDKIRFIIDSSNKKTIDSLEKELQYYDIKTVLK